MARAVRLETRCRDMQACLIAMKKSRKAYFTLDIQCLSFEVSWVGLHRLLLLLEKLATPL